MSEVSAGNLFSHGNIPGPWSPATSSVAKRECFKVRQHTTGQHENLAMGYRRRPEAWCTLKETRSVKYKDRQVWHPIVSSQTQSNPPSTIWNRLPFATSSAPSILKLVDRDNPLVPYHYSEKPTSYHNLIHHALIVYSSLHRYYCWLGQCCPNFRPCR